MRLLILGSMAMISVPGLGSAQSVLERVIEQIDGASNLAQVNGTYANIAESVGVAPTTSTESAVGDFSNAPEETVLWFNGDEYTLTVADLGTTFTSGDGSDLGTYLAGHSFTGSVTLGDNGSLTNNSSVSLLIAGVYGSMIMLPGETASIPGDAQVYDHDGTLRLLATTSSWDGAIPNTNAGAGYYAPIELYMVDVTTTIPGISTTIDGSITNIITGVTSATQEAVAGAATATEFTLPTLDLGDMSTTALGAVNTGEITLGVNSAVDEAKTSSTRAVSAVMTQIGGSADTGALVLNVASNASQVIGSIENTLVAVNGSVGNLSTTALGAVNTGTITSGVNAAVQGIVGMSGQSVSGL